MSYRAVTINQGPGGWGGPLKLQATDDCNKILCVTAGGGIHPIAQKIADLTGAEAVDGYKNSVPDDQVLAVVVDCGGTARCGVYPRKGIRTVNLNPVGAVGPLAAFIKEDIYVSGVTQAEIVYADEADVSVQEDTKADALSKSVASKTTDTNMESKPVVVDKEVSMGKKEQQVEQAETVKGENLVMKIGITIGRIVNKFFAAGRDAIDICIKTILPFMAFTATLLGIISKSGLGNVIAKTVAPLCNTLPGMLAISIVCAIPVLSPILGPGAVIAQTVGILLGSQIGDGNIKAQYALPALFAIDAQVGCDFIPVGLSLGEAESDTISFGTPAVLYSRLITGPVSVIIAFIFSIGLYS